MEPTGKQIIEFMKSKGYVIHPTFNLVAVEDVDGGNNPETFNDRVAIIDGQGKLLLGWVHAATEPGTFYTMNPMNPNGAARVKSGQHLNLWTLGLHQGKYPALVQVSPVTVLRDRNKDFSRTGDKESTGMFGINLHQSFTGDRVGKSSAGCTVIRTFSNLQKILKLCRESGLKRFHYTLIDSREL